jgi:hypothetical protein
MSDEAKFPGTERELPQATAAAFHAVDPVAPETAWDPRLPRSQQLNFFHSGAWARVLAESYGFRSAYFTARHSCQPRAVLPVMEASSWLARRRGISLPFTDECAAVADDSDSLAALTEQVRRHGESHAWTTWEYRGGRSLFPGAPASQSFHGHQLELGGNSSERFARLDGTARTAIRKAQQHRVSVEFSTGLDAVRIFHRHLCQTRQRHGLPPQPLHFFTAIHRHVLSQGHGWIAVARHQQTLVASAVFLHFGRSAIYKFAASDHTFRHLQANHLILWEALERYAQGGFSVFDFGRTSLSNAGLRRFKLAWRPKETVIDYVKYDFRRRCFTATQPDLATGWHNRIFRVLPQPVGRMLGALAYRHMA